MAYKTRTKVPFFDCFGITEQQFWTMVEPEEDPCDCRLWLGRWANGYGQFQWTMSGIRNDHRTYQEAAYRIAYRYFSPHRKTQGQGSHISHLCGLRPCCNPNHLIVIPQAENLRDGLTHKAIFESISKQTRDRMRTSGISFKELSKRLDIPAGVTFRIIHGKPDRATYPTPIKDEWDIPRQPTQWYRTYEEANLRRRKEREEKEAMRRNALKKQQNARLAEQMAEQVNYTKKWLDEFWS